MTQLFDPSSNLISRILIFALIVFLILAGWLLYTFTIVAERPVERAHLAEPVPFNHRHHVIENGISCGYCHYTAAISKTAGMPTTHTCMTCHSRVLLNSPILEPVRQSYAMRIPLRWPVIYHLADFVYFNHSIHVTKGVSCVSCHGDVAQMVMTWKARTFYMKECLECHRRNAPAIKHQRNRLVDCYICHR